MIKVYSDEIYLLTDISNWYIEYLDTGINNMSFDISTKHPLYSKICEETQLEYDNLLYKITTINERTSSDTSTITAQLDLDDLKGIIYPEYKISTQTFDYVCNNLLTGILNGTGWTVQDIAGVTGSRSIDLTDCTPLDIFSYCTNSTVYNRQWIFDNKNKVITPVNTEDKQPTGAYFTDELNLSDVNFKGSSDGLVTRLYAYGKDIDITKYAGRQWIENHDYTDKVIAAVWRDERYTDERSLYDAAVDKLKQLSQPTRSYNCKIRDLAALSKGYDFLGISLYDIVTLIDRNRNTRVNHRVVQIRRYPSAPENNTVTLSSAAESITSKIVKLQSDLQTEKIINKTKWNEITKDVSQNTASIGELYQIGDENKIYLSNMITQTAESTIEQIRKSQSAGAENYIIHPSDFTDTENWKKVNGAAWTLSAEDNYLKVQRSESDTQSNVYVVGRLSAAVIQQKKKANHCSVYARVKSSAACRIYLCYQYTQGEDATTKISVIPPKDIAASNLTTYNGDIYYSIKEADTWCDIYAEIHDASTENRNIEWVGIYLSADTTEGNAPKGLSVWIDYIQVINTPYYEERITTVEKSADEIKSEVSLKSNITDFELYKTDVEQTFNSISLTASNNTRSSNLTVAIRGVEIASAEIKLTGMVAFEDLSTAGRSTITGNNITTGTISSVNKKCKIKLASATIEFATTYSNGITGLFELSPSGLYFKDTNGAIQGSFYPAADMNRAYLLTHRVSIAGTKNSGKSVETSFEAEYGTNGVPTGNLRLVGGSINESFILSNIGILRVNGINFDCRRGKVNLSAAIDTPGLTVDGITYTARYLQSEGVYVLGATS